MFLDPLLSGPGAWALHNAREGVVIAARIEVAADSRSRRKGLLGREGLGAGEALVLVPCGGIHTFWMHFAIDVAFVSKDGRVVKCVHAIPPWRIAVAPCAFAAVELPAGTLRRTNTQNGDVLSVVGAARGMPL